MQHKNFSPDQLPALKEAVYKKFSSRLRDPNTVLSRDADRLTGMAGFDHLGNTPEGKPVVEIANVKEMDLKDYFTMVNDPRLSEVDEMKTIHHMRVFVLDLGKMMK